VKLAKKSLNFKGTNISVFENFALSINACDDLVIIKYNNVKLMSKLLHIIIW